MALTKQLELGNSLVELRLDPVPVEALDVPLLLCSAALEKAMARTEEADFSWLAAEVRSGRAILLIEFLDNVPQGCCVTRLVDYPNFRSGQILAIAGLPGKRMMYPNEHSLGLLKEWFARDNCTYIEGFAGPAVARLWERINFFEASRLMRVAI